ncbi:MAG: VCBS repeat-containing protein [Archangiaceae bacterium]|nr:VCBS repeat-containing protein [Archangiaceae bacterium]
MLMLLAPLLLAAGAPDALLQQLDAQESVNERVEKALDAMCGSLKRGEPPASFPPTGLVQVTSCSMRALNLNPAEDVSTSRLYWELDGRTQTGARRTLRGEGSAHFRPEPTGGLSVHAFELGTPEVVERAAPRFVRRIWVDAPGRTQQDAETMTGGLAVRDLDGDGLPDALWADGPTVRARFSKAPASSAPVEIARSSNGAIFTSIALGDVDGDGDADAALTSYYGGPVRLLRNEGGRLKPWGTLGAGGAHHSALFSDLDGDGALELAVVQYPLTGRWPSSFLDADNGFPLEVYRVAANGRGTAWTLPNAPARWGLAAAAGAFPSLGHGLYVANDFGTNDLWAFHRDGGVDGHAAELGLLDPGNGMGVELGDLDGDHRLDVYVTNMFSKAGTRVLAGVPAGTVELERLKKFARGNTLYLAQADGGYRESAEALGVNRGLWAFGALFADVDDDGRQEVAVANGYLSRPDRTDY